MINDMLPQMFEVIFFVVYKNLSSFDLKLSTAFSLAEWNKISEAWMGKQVWHSSESACLPSLWPGFKS